MGRIGKRTSVGFFLFGLGALGCGGMSHPPLEDAPTGTPAPTATVAAPTETPPLHGGVAPKVDESLIARETFFGNPDRASVKISPDGKQIAYLAPKDGVLNVFVAPVDDIQKAKAVTNDTKRGIRRYFWSYTNKHIIYSQDQEGDENWRAYAVETATGTQKDLTPIEGITARISGVSSKFPNEIVVGLNDRDARLHDLYRVNLLSGERKLIEKNEKGFVGYVVDDDYRVKMGLTFTPDGGLAMMTPGKDGAWDTLIEVGPEDSLATNPMGLDQTGNVLYLQDSRDRDKSALVEIDLRTKKSKVVHMPKKADVSDVIMHPKTHKVQAVAENFERTEWTAMDAGVKADLQKLDELLEGDVQITSQTLDDKHWVVAELKDNGPVSYHHYDRTKKKATFLFVSRSDLKDLKLAKMHPRVIKSRDGLDLVSYLSLPPAADPDGDGKPNAALPMVLDVHGGPWARDSWGYNSYHQWLASRGYAVLSVNYRGSTGFGKKFTNLADGNWSTTMHNDLLDAVKWAVDGGIAQKDKVAIMGGSYGGYATLVGLTFTPQEFACGVDIVGPSSLVTLLENIPPYWAPFAPVLKTRVGDHTTEAGRQELMKRSPLSYVDKIERPLLIAQGANDPRVKQQESDQIVQSMESKKIPVVYVLYPDEGHGFARPENQMSFTAVSEIFLAQCLGGTYEPIGDDFKNSTITVPNGARHVWSLPESLKN